MSGWHQIETAPRDSTVVDLWLVSVKHNPRGERMPDCWYRDDEGWVHDFGRDGIDAAQFYVDCTPTHWRYPPLPPEIYDYSVSDMVTDQVSL